jgi:DNA primase
VLECGHTRYDTLPNQSYVLDNFGEEEAMARIPEEELERLKSEVSLERLVAAKGVRLERRGSDLVGCCPFHEDKEPSLVVTPSKNLWHCLGACQAGGSVVDWVMRAEGVSFRHAVELLRCDLGLVAGPRIVRAGTVRKLPSPVETKAEDAELLRQVVGYYHATLKGSPEVLGYLERRGLRDSELVERFQLGYANRTLGLRLPQGNRQAGADIRGRLQRLGVIRESGHEHFNGSLVVPIVTPEGEVVEMYGRKVTRALRAGTPDHLYLPGPHRGVWNEQGLAGSGGEVIVCEALIDAMSVWVAGYRNVTAAYGVEGFTEEHLAAFSRHGIGRVLIAYDRDGAGDRAAVQLAVRLTGAGMDCFRVQFPQGMDANAFLVEDPERAQERFAAVIRKAVWLGKGKPPLGPGPAAGVRPAPSAEGPELRIRNAPGVPGPDLGVELLAGGDESEGGALEVRQAVPSPPSPPPLAASSEVPAASPVPAGPPPEVLAEMTDSEVTMRFGDRRWRVRGLERNLSYDLLRVNVLVAREESFHVDTLDLYSARARQVFLKQCSEELRVPEETVKKDLGKVLLRLEELAEERIREALEPKSKEVTLEEAERQEAMTLLRDPDLMERIVADLGRCGVVGEETNKLVGYLAAISRKLEQPLAVVVQSTSAAGKSALMEAVLRLVPEEDRVKYSAMTGQSLYYMAEQELAHKVLALVEEEGAERAAYALKLLQSEGELSIASTGKDPQTGRLVTQEYRVEGPVAIFLTTTAIDVDEELLNRCLVLSVDEDREQTRAIHARQRRRQTLAGLLEEVEQERIVRLHRNAQRLLRPVLVANPYAERLTFADERTRTRRDHMKYLTLIRTVALLHQYQREQKVAVQGGRRVTYIEVTPDDIAVANRLAHEVLGRSVDELPPQTRRLLTELEAMVAQRCAELEMERGDVRFSRKEVREWTGWGDTQLRVHLGRLTELEHLLVHRGGRGQSFVYELTWDGSGQDGRPHLNGLLDPAELLLGQGYDGNVAAAEGEVAGSSRPQRGVIAGGARAAITNSGRVQGNGHGSPLTSWEEAEIVSYRQQAVAAELG